MVGKIVEKIVGRMVGKIVGKKVGKIVGKIVGKLVGKMVGKAVEDIQNWQLSAAAPPALRDNKLPFLLLQTTTFAQSYKGRNRLKRHMIPCNPPPANLELRKKISTQLAFYFSLPMTAQ